MFLVIASFTIQLTLPQSVEAASAKYGIVISDGDGNYTFYDFNDSSNTDAAIEISSMGNVMIPVKKLVETLPGLTYQYNASTKKITIKNTNNGKKIVYKVDSKNLSYYSSSKAKAVKKTMAEQAYISKSSSAVMVPMSSLKWVFQTTAGYQYYSTDIMQTAGYDTLTYSGLILYNPYQKVTDIPIATKVTGISSTVRVTIPEGYSVAQIFNLLVKKGVCASTDSLYDAMEKYDFTINYPLIKEIKENENRCFKLEGYLYPDTYDFYRLSKPENAIGIFLRNTEKKLTKEDRDKATAMGYSMDEILTIASMIEKETPNTDEMPIIASVIYNRLNIGKKLQFDSSIYYVERYIQPYISGDINRYNSYYNTYKCSNLPASPICNPGKTAIAAALNPETTDYLFFCSDEEGKYWFSVDQKIWVDLDNPDNTQDVNNEDTTNNMEQ